MNITRDDITLALSIWGATLATILGFLAILKERKDRPLLSVRAFFGKHDPALFIALTNAGRRPISVSAVTAETHTGGKAQLPIVPKTLEQEGSHMHIRCVCLTNISELTDLWATDSLCRQWHLPKKTIRKLRKEAKKLSPPVPLKPIPPKTAMPIFPE